MEILITGGSHVVALNQGLKGLAQSAEIPQSLKFHVRPLGGGLSVAGKFFRRRSDHVEITNPKFRAKFKRIPPAETSYDAVVLSTALYSRPVWNKSDWAIYGVSGISKGRILASDSMLRRAIQDDNRYLVCFLRHLQAFGISAYVVEGPRPFRHNAEVERAGFEIVKYIDRLYRSTTLELLAREGISAILAPEFVYDEDGFMLEQYRHRNPKDKTHGNVDFGRVMMMEVIRSVQRSHSPPSARINSCSGG